MTLPDCDRLYNIVDATWPAIRKYHVGMWVIRKGGNGGSRVNAATLHGATPDVDVAINAMIDNNQRPLFMIREEDLMLDQILKKRGYIIKDPTQFYMTDISKIVPPVFPPVTAFQVWPPLAIQKEIWLAGRIGPSRLAVMNRAPYPKATFLGRMNDKPASTAFAAILGDCVMMHALEVAQPHRQQGMAKYMTQAIAMWAQKQGAKYLTLATTKSNIAANKLYSSLGMAIVGRYHYRTVPK